MGIIITKGYRVRQEAKPELHDTRSKIEKVKAEGN